MAEMETDVYMDLHAREFQAALAELERRVQQLGSIMTAASTKVLTDLRAANAAQLNTAREFTQMVGRLDGFERVAREQNRRGIRGLNEDQTFSGNTRRATIYAQTLNNASTAADGLQARLNRIDKLITEGGDRGNLASRRTLARRMGLEEAQRELVALERQLQKTDDRARRTGESFADAQRRVRDAQNNLTSAVLNPQITNSNFTRERQALRDAQAMYSEAVNELRRNQVSQIRAERRAQSPETIQRQTEQAYRRRSQLMTAEARRQEEIDLAYASRRASVDADYTRALAQRKDQTRQLSALELQGLEQVGALNRRNMAEQREHVAAIRGENRGVAASNRQVGAWTVRRDTNRELATQTSLLQVERMRETSNQRLDALAAQRLAAHGQERIALGQEIRLEQIRNDLIVRRTGQLERAERAAGRPTAPAGPESRLGTILSPGYAAAAFARTGVYGAAAGLAYGAFNAVQSNLTFVVQYEDALKRLQAIAGATDTEMGQLANSIGEVGRNSRFSLLEITQIATRLAQAGVSTSGMPDALSAVTRLATASGSTPEESVDLVTAALGSFQLQGRESARVADLMTEALNRTRLTVQQAALAIQYVGATAYEQNITLEQLLATSAALSQAGIRSGSTIGTGMRQFLVDLQSPSEGLREQLQALNITAADIDVTTRGLPAVLQTLQERGFGAAQAYGSLETRAAAFYLVARNNLELMDQLQISFADQGASVLANERAMNSLTAQWQRFKNIVQEGFSDSLSGLVTIATNLLRQLNDAANSPAGRAAQQANDELDAQLAAGTERFLNGQFMPYTNSSLTESLGLGRPGTWLANLSRDANDASGQMARLEDAISRTSQAASEQRDTVSALDREILRLTTQQRDLQGQETRVTAETVSLMSRFEGLSRHIVDTTGNIGGLIGALQSLRGEEAQTLIDRVNEQVGAFRAREVDAIVNRNSAVRQIAGNPGFMAALTDRERTALSGTGGTAGRVNAQILLEASRRLVASNEELARLLSQAGQNQLAAYSASGQGRTLAAERDLQAFWNTQIGRQARGTLTGAEAEIQRMRTAPIAERAALRDQTVTRLTGTITELNRRLSGATNPQGIGARGARAAIAEAQSLIQQAQASGSQTPEERRAAERAGRAGARAADREAQNITYGSPVRGTPRVTSGVGSRTPPRLPGGGRGSGNHQGVDIGGNTGDPVYATADGVVEFAGTRGSYGKLIILAHGGGATTRYAHLSEIMVRLGQRVSAGEQIGKIGSTGGSTGPHLHYERRFGNRVDRNPLSARGRGDPGALDQLEEAGQDREARNAAATGRMQVGTRNRALREALDNLRGTTTAATFAAGETAVRAAFAAWAEEMESTLEQEIDAQNLTEGEAAERRQALAEQIQQKAAEINTTILERFIAGVERNMEAISREFEVRLSPLRDILATAEGRVQGLGYQSMQGRVPDFVREMAERSVGRAQEGLARGRLAGLPGLISGQTSELALLEQRAGTFAANDPAGDQARQAVTRLRLEIQGLRQEHAQLQAAFSANGLIPTNLGDGLQQAIASYREANNLGRSFNEEVMMGMTASIGNTHQLLTTFFTELEFSVNGVLSAFANLGRGIVQELQNMAARILANKLFNALLNLIGGAVGGGVVPGVGATGGFNGFNPADAFGFIHGGEVRAISGRYIKDGVPGRDSVRARIAKGEFVQRKWAVDSVGVDFMERLNNFGARALDDMRPGVMLPPAAHQEMKVYVVAPENRPSMGPNDVLVTIAEDIMKDGQTKKLIQHVAQGG